MIPPPPLDSRGMLTAHFHEITATIARGISGRCVMCQQGGWDWWDLTACTMAPVVADDGLLIDQVPLHPACVPALLEHWAVVLWGTEGDQPALVPADVSDVAAPTGAYARRSTR